MLKILKGSSYAIIIIGLILFISQTNLFILNDSVEILKLIPIGLSLIFPDLAINASVLVNTLLGYNFIFEMIVISIVAFIIILILIVGMGSVIVLNNGKSKGVTLTRVLKLILMNITIICVLNYFNDFFTMLFFPGFQIVGVILLGLYTLQLIGYLKLLFDIVNSKIKDGTIVRELKTISRKIIKITLIALFGYILFKLVILSVVSIVLAMVIKNIDLGNYLIPLIESNFLNNPAFLNEMPVIITDFLTTMGIDIPISDNESVLDKAIIYIIESFVLTSLNPLFHTFLIKIVNSILFNSLIQMISALMLIGAYKANTTYSFKEKNITKMFSTLILIILMFLVPAIVPDFLNEIVIILLLIGTVYNASYFSIYLKKFK